MKESWKNGLCIPWLIVILILYAIPFISDLWPDLDSYLGGYGPLGIWGTLAATILATVFSIGYGFSCVHQKTAYRCIGFGSCSKTKDSNGKDRAPLFWSSPEDEDVLRPKYEPILLDPKLNKGWTSHVPWSEYSWSLKGLNDKYLYNKETSASRYIDRKIQENPNHPENPNYVTQTK